MKWNKLLTNAIVLGVLLLVGFGCQGIKLPFGGGGAVSESTDPKEAVQIAFKKFMEAKFYRAIVKTKNAQASVETEIDFNAPDRFWIKNNLGTMKNEVIAIGNDSYMRMNEGKWSKMPAGKSVSIGDMRGKMSAEALAAMKDFEAAGKEALNGKETFVYKFKSTYGGESSSKMWISADSGLPLKVDSEGSYSGNKLEMSITYDYDKETKIESPKIN
jgi:hypothetical protein